ncbi:hypothetical protein HNQ60_004066 [Povalibacter uvarum]|uniref:DinB-like domain-containing protein n=1 Tax=Povalibacter uvarum TaxID=732238 RepID=A0A841HQM4_9GAMM|nr:DinB family protein [Povalibacter uvarum]MBB6095176.1 hypothetical protein [Povalibacter uvarum]
MNVTLSALAAFPDQLAAHFAAIPSDLRHWTPPAWEGIPSERLTPIEQLCHVRDIEVEGYHVRFQRTLQEDNPLLPSIDTDAYARDRAYGKSEPEVVIASIRAARAKTLSLITGLTESQLDRTAVFEGYGPLTLRSLIHYLCSHDQQHLAGLQWLLGKMHAKASTSSQVAP